MALAAYRPKHSEYAEGYVAFDKKGAICVDLVGACAMSQEELDFIGGIIADAFNKLSPEQEAKLRSFKSRE